MQQVEGSVQFWINDWYEFGVKKGFTKSKVYDELEEITGLSRKTLKNIKVVSENVPTSGRLKDLSFSHHVEVAKLLGAEK